MLRDMRLEGAFGGTAQAHRYSQHVPVPSCNDGGDGKANAKINAPPETLHSRHM